MNQTKNGINIYQNKPANLMVCSYINSHMRDSLIFQSQLGNFREGFPMSC